MKSTRNVLAAIAKFQQEIPVIFKESKGYGYAYADLPTIFEQINPVLKKHGLGFTQIIDDDHVITIVFHSDTGEKIKSRMKIEADIKLAGMNKFQVIGSAITYMRRYALSSMLGLVTDKDNDGNGNDKEEKKDKKPTSTRTNKATTTTAKKEENKLKELVEGTREYTNVIAGIQKGTITKIDEVRKHYTFSNTIMRTINEEIEKKKNPPVEENKDGEQGSLLP